MGHCRRPSLHRLAGRVAGLKHAAIRGILVPFEKAPTERRTATAGWFRTSPGATPLALDDEGRIRSDTWELTEDVQAAAAELREAAATDAIADLADLDWFHADAQRLSRLPRRRQLGSGKAASNWGCARRRELMNWGDEDPFASCPTSS
ncbi:hypothetical protein ACF09C_27355 [Streptomyces sp. NPDC014870]|uniref:hypothetical protein n=1 Tax=Streptomyces sp. NPDC014870 TaxID=3364925 RepID=UPI0036F801A8